MEKKYRLKMNLQLFAAEDPVNMTLEQALMGSDLLVYSRNLTINNEYLNPLLFPPKETSELTIDVIRSSAGRLPVMAQIAELGTEVEYGSREGLSGTRIEIPKIQRGRYMDERLVRLALQASSSFGLRPQEANQLRNEQLNDAQYAVDSINARKEWIAMQAVSNGAVTYNEGNVKIAVDWGYETAQKPVLTSTDRWSDYDNSTPITDIQGWVEERALKGIKLARSLTSRKILSHLLQNKSIRLQYFGNPSGSAQPPQLNRAQLNAVFDSLGLPQIAINDTQLRTEDKALTNGKVTYTTTRTFADSKFMLLPEGPLGNYLWAKTTEEMLAEIEAVQTGDMGIYVFRDVTKNPIRVRTAGVALSFPAFAWADSVVSATVI
ncbi:major capsid protein [Paenibacillus koleovorans]|uniref:major capsid protein n=1 Tax=Paenibacillus koleovorans TaxID=121608 RepID=UPI000FDBAFB8|nr:major capsid protein [Paenibacillus koleovorans]